MKISANDDRSSIARRLGATVTREDLRTSDARQSRLETNARRRSRSWGTTVDIDPDHQTAHVDAQSGDDPHIVVTGREIEQSATDIDGKAWDRQAQRALGIHEVGHIRYSDISHRDNLLDGFSPGDKAVAHSLWNALEDGAIESQLVQRWSNSYGPLRALRANLFAAGGSDDIPQGGPGKDDPEEGGQVYFLAHAAQATCLDLWMREVYSLNIGIVDGLLDDGNEHHFFTENDEELYREEVLPLTENVVPDILSQADARKRNERIFEYVQNILDILNDADGDGKTQMQDEGESGGNDGTGMPDDSRENHSGEATADADELRPASDDPEDSDAEEIAPGAAQGDESDVEQDLEAPEDIDVPDEIEEQGREEASDDAREEAGATDSMLDEMEEMQEAMGRSDELKNDSILVPDEDWQADEGRYQDSLLASKRLSQVLRNRLQQERRTEVQRNRRRGRLDSASLHRTAVGETEVFEQKNEPEEKDYHCVLVLDRSGSMSGREIKAAERAVGMTILALEEVGVETMLLELYNSNVRLAKPFGVDSKSARDSVWHGHAHGGTPLPQMMDMARARLNRESGNRFVVCVTDGEVAASSFEQSVDKCSFPVLGIQIGGGSNIDDSAFHRAVTARGGDDIEDELTNLVNEVMF